MDGESLQGAIERLAPRVGLRGFSAGISEAGHVCWSMVSGPADRAGLGVTPKTLFPVASLTKPVAATLIMRLVERGALDLDASAGRSISDLTSPHRQMIRSDLAITVRHLLTHTAAIPAIALFRKKPTGEPGVRYRYSGAAFGVLTDIIEAAGAATFAEQLDREILGPCAMTDTYPGTAAVQDAGLGSPLASPVGRPGLLGRLLKPAPTANAAAGLVSTVRDYLRFDAALANGALVNANTLSAMWTPAVLRSSQSSPYGLGFFVQTIRGERVVWHYGPARPPLVPLHPVRKPRSGIRRTRDTDGLGRDGKLSAGDLSRSSTARALMESLGV